VFSASNQLYFKPSDKAVILSEAPHSFIAYVFLQNSHKIVILSGAPHSFIG